jgi:hypothetical protein
VTILTLLLNPDDQPSEFLLPAPRLPCRVLLDSAAPDEPPGEARHEVVVGAHSAVLLYTELAG